MLSGGSGGGTVAPWNPSITVDTTTTLGSGGGADWWGRSAVKRRPDGVLVLVYYRSTGHVTNDGFCHTIMSDDDGATWTAEDTDLDANVIPDIIPSAAGAGEDAGEPWLYVAPNGDLVLHTWRVNYGSSNNGSYQFRYDPAAHEWVEEGKLAWTGGSLSSTNTFQTDDDFVYNGVTYAGVRTYNGASYTDCYMSLVKNATPDLDVAAWEYVSDITGPSETACIEVGIEYVGNSTIIAMLRSLAHNAGYRRVSTDMGATWGSLDNVTSSTDILGRNRVYTRMHLRGEAGWWKDPNLVMVGYVQTDPGNSQGRRNAVWFSPDRGTTWSAPQYIDTTNDDGGYGDIFATGDATLTVVNYRGTLTAASLKQYDLTVDLTA
jgi:hypothetical protein